MLLEDPCEKLQSWIKAQKKEPTCMLQVWFQKTPEHTFSLYLNPIKISSISAHI